MLCTDNTNTALCYVNDSKVFPVNQGNYHKTHLVCDMTDVISTKTVARIIADVVR